MLVNPDAQSTHEAHPAALNGDACARACSNHIVE